MSNPPDDSVRPLPVPSPAVGGTVEFAGTTNVTGPVIGGGVSGNVYYTTNTPPPPPLLPAPPWTVPYARNLRFVGREQILTDAHWRLEEGEAVVLAGGAGWANPNQQTAIIGTPSAPLETVTIIDPRYPLFGLTLPLVGLHSPTLQAPAALSLSARISPSSSPSSPPIGLLLPSPLSPAP